jgi:hypothetical protein
MVLFHIIPRWFFGYDIMLEVVFAVITLLVAFYAWKFYRLSGKKDLRLLSLGFLFISLSYFALSAANFEIITSLTDTGCKVCRIEGLRLAHVYVIYLFMVFAITGWTALTYMVLRLKSPKTFVLLLLLGLLTLFISPHVLYVFYMVSSLLLIFILIQLITNYVKYKHSKQLLVIIAFGFLLFGRAHFVVSVNHSLFYVIGHILELIAYALILANLLSIKWRSNVRGYRSSMIS